VTALNIENHIYITLYEGALKCIAVAELGGSALESEAELRRFMLTFICGALGGQSGGNPKVTMVGIHTAAEEQMCQVDEFGLRVR
jgi:hypothetical protein